MLNILASIFSEVYTYTCILFFVVFCALFVFCFLFWGFFFWPHSNFQTHILILLRKNLNKYVVFMHDGFDYVTKYKCGKIISFLNFIPWQ